MQRCGRTVQIFRKKFTACKFAVTHYVFRHIGASCLYEFLGNDSVTLVHEFFCKPRGAVSLACISVYSAYKKYFIHELSVK